MENIMIYFGSIGIAGTISLIVLAVLGVLIAIRGRQAMVWVVGVCATAVGILAGAMAGLLIFNSFILMIIFAIAGGVGLVLLVRYVKAPAYFIGIGVLSFLIAYIVTSEMIHSSAKLPESTLLAADMVIGMIMGALSLIQSKYMVSVITSVSGGMITSVCVMTLLGSYFTDWRTWAIAVAVAVLGMIVQIKIYDLTPRRRSKPIRNKHEKRKH